MSVKSDISEDKIIFCDDTDDNISIQNISDNSSDVADDGNNIYLFLL